MATNPTYTLAPLPHWVVVDNFSKLPPGAAIYTFSSLDPHQAYKPAYQDPGGQFPYSQPIEGFSNGTFPPIYWKFDPNDPDDLYYVEFWSARKENGGVFLYDINNFTGAGGGGGGGGTITTAYDIENLVGNNVFYHNTGNTTGTSVPSPLLLAPGIHDGFVADSTSVNGPVGPDIVFAKNSAIVQDNIKFPDFSIGTNPFSPDPTPQFYFEYQCTAPVSGETYKYVQFPIANRVQNLSGVTISGRIYAQSSSNSQITLTLRQYFGSGTGGSADVVALLATYTLTSSWAEYNFTSQVVPSIFGKTLGGTGICQNDGLFLQVNLPRGQICTVDFIKPELFIGTVLPPFQFDSYDEIDGLVNTPRTGDVRTSINSFVPGWVIMNEGTIGNSLSGATTFANNMTFPLFNLIWNTFSNPALQNLAQMYPPGVVPNPGVNNIAYGSDAPTDFIAGNQIQLTAALGRVMAAVSGTTHTIGQSVGSETHMMQGTELAPHAHTIQGVHNINAFGGGSADGYNNFGLTTATSTVPSPSSQTAFTIMQPTVYMNVFMKL